MSCKSFTFYLTGALLALLAGCEGFNPVADTAVHFIQRGSSVSVGGFAPGFEYLEVEWQGRKSSLALGYREVNGSTVVDHWYSGHGEMIKLVNGRIAQVLGMTSEIRSATEKAPEWSELMSHRLPIVWVQSKDTMPAYRYGVKEYVISQQVSATRVEASTAALASHWFLEEVKSKDATGKTWIYQQKFAVANNVVVYSEQCVAPDMCFKLKPLGVVVSR